MKLSKQDLTTPALRLPVALLCLLLLLTACTGRHRKYVIGVSQCSADIWREKLNKELQTGTYLYDDVELSLVSADDNNERQKEQVRQFVHDGIDLLILAPNEMAAITPLIDSIYDAGIPVIVFDRKTTSKKYTAAIGADNYAMGRAMGEYIAAQLPNGGNVVEVMGRKGSSPAIERHHGFTDAIKRHPNIRLLASLQGDWTEESGEQAMKQWLSTNPPNNQTTKTPNDQTTNTQIDFVFGQNDRMAVGARKALLSPTTHHPSPKFCGIDGLPGKGGGLECVRDSILDATYIYPTRGDMVLRLAINILRGEPYEHENAMKSAIVTHANAEAMLMQAEEIDVQNELLGELHNRVDEYLAQYRHQQVYLLLLVIIVLLIIGSAAYVIRSKEHRHQMEREALQLVVAGGLPQEEASREVRSDATSREGRSEDGSREGRSVKCEVREDMPLESPAAEPILTPHSTLHPSRESSTLHTPRENLHTPQEHESSSNSRFLEQLRQQVQEHMGNSDYGVEELAADMHLSRVQLYRKTKLFTGQTPVDIIRQSRLNRARLLLATTDKNVSEVAYEVGFTAPSYFTKCFKDAFGILPGEVKSEN